jgi:anaerobic selenocysteine-containing dehydrogenase
VTESAPAGFALHLARVLYDGGTLVTMGDSLAPLAPEPAAHLHPDDAARLGVGAGDRVTVGGAALPVVLDPTLAPRTVYVPFNLGVALGNALDVKVEKA